MSTTVPPGDLLPASPQHATRLLHPGWLPPAILAIVALLNGAGLLLVTRRLAGAFSTDLPLWQVFVTALVATAMAWYARTQWRRQVAAWDESRQPLLDLAVGWGTSTGLLLLAAGCCYPGYRNGEWLAWLPLLIADQFWRQNFFDNGQPGQELTTADTDLPTEPDEQECLAAGVALGAPSLAAEDDGSKSSDEEASGASDEETIQQVFRVRDADGQEVVYAAVRADFLAGQRNAIVHVGFCPPLPATPHVEAAACHWPDVRVRVTQALPHGVRLDVRLGEPAEEACGVPIDLAAAPSLPRSPGGAARVV